MSDKWNLNPNISIATGEANSKQEFSVTNFEPIPLSFAYIISSLFALSYAFLSFSMMSSVLVLFSISLPSSLIAFFSVLTGITYATISNKKALHLVHYVFSYLNGAQKLDVQKKLILFVGFIIGLFISYNLALEFSFFWPVIFSDLSFTFSIISSFSFFIIFFDSVVELVEEFKGADFNPFEIIAILSSLSVFVLTFFITGPLHLAVAFSLLVGLTSVVLSDYTTNNHSIFTSFERAILKYLALVFHSLGEGAVVRGSSPSIVQKIAGLFTSVSEIVCDYDSVNGDSRYYLNYKLQKNNYACLIFDSEGRYIESESFILDSTDPDDDFINQSIAKKFNYNVKKLLDHINLYKQDSTYMISLDGKFIFASDSIENFGHINLKSDIPDIKESAKIPLLNEEAFNSPIHNESGFHKPSLFFSIASFGYGLYLYNLLPLIFYCSGLCFLWSLITITNHFSSVGQVKPLDLSHKHGFNYLPFYNRLFFSKNRIPSYSLRMIITLSCVFFAIFSSYHLPILIFSNVFLNSFLQFSITYYLFKEILNFSIWIFNEDLEQQYYDIQRFNNYFFSFDFIFNIFKMTLVTLISSMVGINGGYEFVTHTQDLPQAFHNVFITIFIFFAWMTEGVFLNDNLTSAIQSKDSSDFNLLKINDVERSTSESSTNSIYYHFAP